MRFKKKRKNRFIWALIFLVLFILLILIAFVASPLWSFDQIFDKVFGKKIEITGKVIDASSNLIAEYKLDGDYRDTSIRANDGSGNNGVSFASDSISGKSAVFDGIDDYIESDINIDGISLTLSFWFNTKDANSIKRIIEHRWYAYPADSGVFTTHINNGKVYAGLTMADGSQPFIPINDIISANNWYHYVLTYNGSAAQVYLNGVLKNSFFINKTLKKTKKSLILGGVPGVTFNGNIDEVQIYNIALSQDEVKNIYENYRKVTEPQPAYCLDSDSGKNILVIGKVNTDKGVYNDRCYTQNAVAEYSCLENAYKVDFISCPSGYTCSSGACILSTSPTPTPAPTPACTDSDGGIYSKVKGIVNISSKLYSDVCYTADTVYEYYCSGINYGADYIKCPSGYSCSNGACVLSGGSCSDSDNGINYTKKGQVYYNGTYYNDTCISTSGLREEYCYYNQRASTIYTCPTGKECNNGACVLSVSSLKEICYDSDNGINYTKAGFVNATNILYYDFCSSSKNITEYYCLTNSVRSVTTTCEEKCDKGICFVNAPKNIKAEEEETRTILPPYDLLAFSFSSDSIFLIWKSNSDNVNFTITRSLSENGLFIPSSNISGDRHSYLDTNLRENTTYYYKIYAYDGSLQSIDSRIVYARTFLNFSSVMKQNEVINGSVSTLPRHFDSRFFVIKNRTKIYPYAEIRWGEDPYLFEHPTQNIPIPNEGDNKDGNDKEVLQ